MGVNLAAHWWIIMGLVGLVVVAVTVVIAVIVARSSRSRGPICPDPSAHLHHGQQHHG